MQKHKKGTIAIVICALLLLTSCSGPSENSQHGSPDEPDTSFSGTPPMNPLDTQEVIPGVFAVKSEQRYPVNFFLIKSGDLYIAIDAGEFGPDKAEKELEKLGISSDDVAVVFLTHTHLDHIGALPLFDKATVYMGGPSNPRLSRVELADDEVIDVLGTSVQCIYARGHAKDAVCYLVDSKYLFTGDTLSLLGDHVKLFFSKFNSNNKIQKEDIIKLSNLEDIQYMFTAHHGYTNSPVFPQTK